MNWPAFMVGKGDSETSVLEASALPVAILGNGLLAWLVAGLLWLWIGAFKPAMDNDDARLLKLRASMELPTGSVVKEAAVIDVASLHLLGEFQPERKVKPKAKPKPKPVKKRLKRTALKLKLRGVIRYPGEPDRTRVMLVNANGKEKVYKVGDSVDDRAKLLEISSKEIILEVDGERQVLEIAKSTAATTSRTAATKRSKKRWPKRPRRTSVIKR